MRPIDSGRRAQGASGLVVGVDGPAVIVPHAVALFLATDLRNLYEARRLQYGAQRDLLKDFEQVVLAAEEVVRAERKRSMSAAESDSGRLLSARTEPPHTATSRAWLTAIEAGDVLHLGCRHVTRLCRDGVLRGEQPGGPGSDWIIDPDSVEAERRKREP